MSQASPLLTVPVPTSLTEGWLKGSVFPLFSRALQGDAHRKEIYLANHSLGRPLDRTAEDITEGLNAWYDSMERSWDDSGWAGEISRFRRSVAELLGFPDGSGVVPKASTAQGLRAILNSFRSDRPVKILTTSLEFDSADFLFQRYEEAGRAKVTRVEPTQSFQGVPILSPDDLISHLDQKPDIVFVSHVVFMTGQLITGISELAQKAHEAGAIFVLDVYHSLGCVPLNMIELDADFALGGCYKYLRGGPGAGFLAIHPRILEAGWMPIDIGWFTKQNPFEFLRGPESQGASGGDGWLESTPAVLPLYQARAGLELTRTLTVPKIREYTLKQQAYLISSLEEKGLHPVHPSQDHPFGAFVAIPLPNAGNAANLLRRKGVNGDSRGDVLRLCPDLLNTQDDLETAACLLAETVTST